MGILESKPKYKQLKELLFDGIRAGKYPVESRFPSENELIREFAVSKHTVLKAIGELVNENLLYRRQGSGTYVKPQGHESRPGGLESVAVLDYEASRDNPALTSVRLLGGFERRLKNDGRFAMNLAYTNGVPENEVQTINRLAPFVSGFALLTLFREGRPNQAVELLKNRGIPFVSLLSWPNALYQDSVDFVAPDDFQGGALAAGHLVDSGCAEIFMVMPDSEKYSIVNYDKRLAGCLDALKRRGIKTKDVNILRVEVKNEEHPFEQAGYRAAEALPRVAGRGGKLGVFALMSDQVASGMIKRLQEEGVKVPQEVVVCGYDNLSESSEWAGDFSTVETSIADIGHRGALLLQERIASGASAAPRHEITPVKLLRRGGVMVT